MKVLWFTNTSSLYQSHSGNTYNGGGWIESLEKLISNEPDIELGIAFFHPDECFKHKQGNTTYYPIPLYNTKLKKIRHNLSYGASDAQELDYFLKITEDFKPDVIHVFGSEKSFGLLCGKTKAPVVIHLQGILNPYLNAYFPPGSSKADLRKRHAFNPAKLMNILRVFSFFVHDTRREEKILKSCSYFMGRTAWDKDVALLYAPSATYYYCSEVLRDVFYKSPVHRMRHEKKLVLMSTISKTSYKGFDMILKTAELLKKYTSIDFEWNIFGVSEYAEWERQLGIGSGAVNVYLKGVAGADVLLDQLQKADVFIHTSYIDNSPNSVCEAQMAGLPVISTNVGGISSLVENNVNGMLVPANDPFTLAARIADLEKDPVLAAALGSQAQKTAMRRHDRNTIRQDLLSIYKDMIHA